MNKVAVDSELGPIAILGGGNVGQALARGLLATTNFRAADITLTRHHVERLAELAGTELNLSADNRAAVERARQVVVAVQPQQLDALLSEIRGTLEIDEAMIKGIVTSARKAVELYRKPIKAH